mgnify:CR=1 FL=1
MNMNQEDKLWYYKEIGNTVDEFNEIVLKNSENINRNKRLKYIVYYTGILSKYGKSVSLLKSKGLNMSIESLTRDLLEYYVTTKKLINLYNDTKFEYYLKYLILLDLKQDVSIYKSIKEDRTISDSNRLKLEESYIKRFKFIIKKIFNYKLSDEINNRTLNNKVLDNTINQISKSYNDTKKNTKGKTYYIGRALEDNKSLKKANNNKAYEESYTIYKDLCRYTHGNLGIIDDKLVKNGMIDFSGLGPNTDACVQLVYYCLKDTVENLKMECLS